MSLRLSPLLALPLLVIGYWNEIQEFIGPDQMTESQGKKLESDIAELRQMIAELERNRRAEWEALYDLGYVILFTSDQTGNKLHQYQNGMAIDARLKEETADYYSIELGSVTLKNQPKFSMQRNSIRAYKRVGPQRVGVQILDAALYTQVVEDHPSGPIILVGGRTDPASP